MQEKEHTPTPWKVDLENHTIFEDNDGRGFEIAEVNTRNHGMEESLANAEFIVKACNSHAKQADVIKGLMGALEAMIGMYHGVFGCVNPHVDSEGRAIRCCVCGTVEEAEAALATAKELK